MSWASASASPCTIPSWSSRPSCTAPISTRIPGAVVGHNERLEFYGDAVIGLVVSRLLYDRYPDEDEGFLTARRAALVNREALAAMALDLGFDRYLHLGSGESDGGGATRPSLLAASFEALAGAVSLSESPDDDDGRPVPALRAARAGTVRDRWTAEVREVEAPGVEPATPWRRSPATAWSGHPGPPHAQEFEVDVVLDGRRLASGSGSSRQRAEESAARDALEVLDAEHSGARATMSRLKELQLHGFKSFADPTRFVFEPGVNAVIGPNGSGKSNMADAVRWVLGEQSNRSLRTRRSDDVIFAGSEQRRAQGMAEAILTLDNSDGWLPIEFSEVAIGRRAYRSGDSEYLINGARARLRDVTELLGEGRLGANELVVVGQGTVDAALSLRPEERRQLFEEAAGVKGLQVRRNEASVRLTRAGENLARVNDLVAELKPQARRLALQAEHQQQHDTLGARARALVIASHDRRERRARELLGEARRAAALAESQLAAYRESREATRREIAAAEERYWQAEEAAREAARSREATREALIRSEGRLEAIDIAAARAGRRNRSGRATTGGGAACPRRERRRGRRPGVGCREPRSGGGGCLARRGGRARRCGCEASGGRAGCGRRSRLETDRIVAAARSAEETTRRTTRREQAQAEVDRLTDEHRQAEAARATALSNRDTAEHDAEGASAALVRAAEDRDAAQVAADEARQRAVELAERLRALRAELAAAEEPHDAASRLGRRLASAGWAPLLDALAAPEEAWAAVEAVVGGELEGALLWADADPSAEVGDARGSARLLVPGDADDTGREAALAAVRGERTLADWVGVPDAPLAFSRAVIAPDLTRLLAGFRQLPAGWCAVTPDGDLADARGVVVLRGRGDPPGGASARAHARQRELRTAVAGLEVEATAAQEAGHQTAERLRRARDAHVTGVSALEAAEQTARRARDELDAVASTTTRLEERIAAARAELEALEGAADDADACRPGRWRRAGPAPAHGRTRAGAAGRARRRAR